MSRKLKPVSPGEMLVEEFLMPKGSRNYRLAKEIAMPVQRIGEIVAGRRPITADTDLRLCRFFGLSDGSWYSARVQAIVSQLAGQGGPDRRQIADRDLRVKRTPRIRVFHAAVG